MGHYDNTVKSRFKYNSKNGKIFWKTVLSGRGKNKIKSGQEAGSININGYRYITFDRKQLRAHRLAWFLFYKKWPKNQIDHINGNKLDNRISNLRDVSGSENCSNKKKHRSGHLLGTTLCKKTGKWVAQFRKGKSGFNLGRFETKEEAHLKYKEFVNELSR